PSSCNTVQVRCTRLSVTRSLVTHTMARRGAGVAMWQRNGPARSPGPWRDERRMSCRGARARHTFASVDRPQRSFRIVRHLIIKPRRKMKVTVVGAGNVGATCADAVARWELANEVVLLDIKEGFAEGKALDIWQTAPISLFDSRITGSTNDYSKTAGS